MGSKAMRIERHYTQPGVSPYDLIPFATTKSEIRNPDGSVVFSLEGVEVPPPGARSRPTCWRRNISAKRASPRG